MLATSITAAVLGVEAHLVRVEADSAPGFPRFTMVGLADSAVRESESRIRAALRNCGIPFKWDRRITVNLAPAGLRKYGSSFDLATAVGLLAADGAFPCVTFPTCCSWRVGPRRQPAPGRRGTGRPCCWRAATAWAGPSSRPRTTARRLSRPAFPCTPPPRCRTRSRSWPRRRCPRRLPPRTPAWTDGSRRATWPTSAARPWRAERSRSPPPGATTCSSSARPARGRRCWPDA